LDVNIPEMSGPEIFSRLRALPAADEVPIVFMTAHCGDEELDLLGPAGVIEKPITTELLAEEIAEVFHANDLGGLCPRWTSNARTRTTKSQSSPR
jgi:CheY-like chemotaxis protein